jgi:hypothetical protein
MTSKVVLISIVNLISFFCIGQNPTIDYYGEIKYERIKQILENEKNAQRLALENDVKIAVLNLNSYQQKVDSSGKSIKIDDNFDILKFKGKRFYQIGEEIEYSHVETSSFIEYYNSLTDDFQI